MQNKKKKKGFGYYLYAIVVLFLTIANITLATLLLTYVQEVEVTGTNYSEKNEIVEWFQEDKFTANSLYSFWKIKFGSYEKPVYLEDIDLSFHAPWKIRLEVTEKEIVAGMLMDDAYIYFDKDGLVMVKSQEPIAGINLIEGLEIIKESEDAVIEQFEQLNIKDEKIFTIIINFVAAIDKQELSPDKIVWEEDSMNLYFGEICVQLGKTNFDEKLIQLPVILAREELQGKSGILHMEKYNETSDKISFEQIVTDTKDDNTEDNYTEDNNTEDNDAGNENTGSGQSGNGDSGSENVGDENTNTQPENSSEPAE